MYGFSTDKTIDTKDGKFATHRSRYLNSGFIMGPVSDMKLLFRRAQEKAEALESSDNASHRDSDQFIFQEIFGEQEYQREVMRRTYAKSHKWSLGVGNDILEPPFEHNIIEHKRGKPDEFSMGVDYWSDMAHQTADSAADATWITYNRPVKAQASRHSSNYTCKLRMTGSLPQHIITTRIPRAAVSDASQFSPNRGWDELELYTNTCLDTIPVMVQHMGTKKERDDAWLNMWMQPHGRRLMDEIVASGDGKPGAISGAYSGEQYIPWQDLCPVEVEGDLYREYDDLLLL